MIYWICKKCGAVYATEDKKITRRRCDKCGYWMEHSKEPPKGKLINTTQQ